MRYEFKLAPADPKSMGEYLNSELFKIAQALSLPRDELFYEPLAAAPKRPRKGMTVYADGTNWNPTGAGEGLYRYTGSAWIFVG